MRLNFLIKGTALCVLLCLVPDPSRALDPSREASQHAFQQWRINDTLPQNSVRAVSQGPDGVLWLSTHAGLQRFDGVTFDTVPGAPEVLSSYHVYAMASDARGGIWIGTNGGGLLHFTDGEFHHYSPSDGFPAKVVMSLEVDGDRVWVGSEGSGLVLVDKGEIRHWGEEQGIPHRAIHDLSIGPDGSCWATVLAGGVFNVTPSGRIMTLGQEQGLISPMVRSVQSDPDGTLWVGLQDGLGRRRDGTWRYWTPDTGFPEVGVSRMLRDRDGNLWIGTLGGGVFRVRPGGDELEAVFPGPEPPLKIIWSFFEDREGSLWIGSLSNGLGRLFDGPVVSLGTSESGTFLRANSVAEDRDGTGTLWVSTYGAGIQRYRDGAAGSPLTTEDGLSSNSHWGLGFDRDGDLWAASMLPGVDHISSPGSEASTVTTYTARDGLGAGRILGIHGDRDGSVWILGDNGVGRAHPNDGPGKRKLTLFTVADGLVDNRANTVTQTPPGAEEDRIWIGTNGGISVWSEESGFRNYTAADGLRNERVWSILPETDGSAWFGTFGGGLHRLRDGKVDLVLNSSHGLPSNDVTALLDDGIGHFWLGTTRGLARISRQELEGMDPIATMAPSVLKLDVAHGMRGAEVYGGDPRGIRSSDGRLFFVSSRGLASVDPDDVQVSPPPRVDIRALQLDEELVALPPSLTLPPSFRRLSIFFTTDTLITPDRIRSRYRLLEGGESDGTWLPLRDRVVEISRLPPGRYGVEIEASDGQGSFEGRATRFEFTVEPGFRDTWAFKFLTGMLLIALGLSAQRWRVRMLRAKQAELQEAVDEALAKVQVLKGLLPMCSSCKKIRDDEGYWQGVETFITDHSEAAFSHGLCPGCADSFLAEHGTSLEEGTEG